MQTNEGFLPALMMDTPLTIASILHRAAQFFPEKEIVSRYHDGSIHRMTYRDLYTRVVRLMNVLRDLGVRPGDRVASCAWNSHRHLELYFAVPCIGAVLHTVNIRLFPEQMVFITNHAEDTVVFADLSLAGTLAGLQSDLKTVRTYVLMNDGAEMPSALPSPHLDYEELLADACDTAIFPDLHENTAASICYTSGTTGEPKGVLYSHRSLYLHAMGCCMTDSFGICEREVVLPVVPMFHAKGWGLPYACAMAGAKQVMPGSHLIGKPLAELLEQERVTFSAGVPTVWNLLYQHLKHHPHDLSHLKTIVSGGSTTPKVLIDNYERDFGIALRCVWGMTEMSPVGSVCRLKAGMEDWPQEEKLRVLCKQGPAVAGVEMRILDEYGKDLPWDGKQAGELVVRGPWVSRSYYADSAKNSAFMDDGWFRTGDIATIDEHGYMEITDRAKDVIKSRGEWISSVDMENTVMSHPDVLEAVVVGRPDDLRGEAPVVFIVLRNSDKPVSPQAVLDVLKSGFARWQLPKPSDIHTVTSLPKTSVGKMDKKALRRLLETEKR